MFKKFTQSEFDQKELTVRSAERIFCARCDAPITDTARGISVGGRWIYRRRNPDNVEFSFRCFSAAPGARKQGDHTFEHTWFPGYGWCFALCARCGTHLGWHFQGKGRFYGLIVDRLRYEGRP